MVFGMGFSTIKDPAAAVRQAADEVQRSVGDPQVYLVFAAGSYDMSLVQQQAALALAGVPFVGGSVPGLVIQGSTVFEGIGILALGDVGNAMQMAVVSGGNHDSKSLGEAVGQTLQRGAAPSGTVFVFAASASDIEASTVLRSLHGQMGPGYSYAGALLGLVLFTDQGICQGGLAALVLANSEIQVEVGHGWTPLPEPMIVTKTHSKVICELDGQPARDRYLEVIRRHEPCFSLAGLSRYPLGIPSIGGRFLMRDVLGPTASGDLRVAADVPAQAVVLAMTADLEMLIQAAGDAADRALRGHKEPSFMLVFDCISRFMLLKDDYIKAVGVMQRTASGRAEMFGLLTNGEISSSEGAPLLYNKSVVFAVGGSVHGCV